MCECMYTYYLYFVLRLFCVFAFQVWLHLNCFQPLFRVSTIRQILLKFSIAWQKEILRTPAHLSDKRGRLRRGVNSSVRVYVSFKCKVQLWPPSSPCRRSSCSKHINMSVTCTEQWITVNVAVKPLTAVTLQVFNRPHLLFAW